MSQIARNAPIRFKVMRCIECNSLARKRPNRHVYICVNAGCGATYVQQTLFGEDEESGKDDSREWQTAKKKNAKPKRKVSP